MGLIEDERGITPQPMTGRGQDYIHKESESLQSFKKRIDKIIENLSGKAPANPTQLKQNTLNHGSFGSAQFLEATDLAGQYEKVLQQLTKLSTVLGQQMEAMGIAVDGADKGFNTMDDDTRRRFWQLQGNPELHRPTDGGEGNKKTSEEFGI